MRRAFLVISIVLALRAGAAAAPDLRLELVRESLTGTHFRYRQYIAGRAVQGAELVVTVTRSGETFEEKNLVTVIAGTRARGNAVVNDGGIARFVDREVVTRRTVEPFAEYRDPDSGALLFAEPLFFNAKEGRVFEQNPVVKLNAPQLRDQNDSASAVPEAAYSTVVLPDLEPFGPLRGPWVTIADLEPVTNVKVDAASSLFFDRAHDGFEEVNSYFQVDRSQRHLQSLGYRGIRGVVQYSIPVDPHGASGLDNSYYISAPEPGYGRLIFGDGGTDDAEDADLIVHEYSHAIQDWIAPGVFGGGYPSESRAIGEGLGDYWAFSSRYATARASGRDPYCIADWDARCQGDNPSEQCSYGPDADCLRRVDSTRTMAGFESNNSPGTEHRNGQIISSALREFFEELVLVHGVDEGRRRADTIVIESLFGTAPDPTFATFARRMLLADRLLFGREHEGTICSVFAGRGVPVDCATAGPATVHWYQSQARNVAIPDRDPAGVVSNIVVTDPRLIESVAVAVNITHPLRGDLRLVLIAPDGTEVVLLEPSGDRSADLVTVFGRESRSAEPLEQLRGRSAAGVWQLRVADTRPLDVGTLISWSLALTFAGEAPVSGRPPVAEGERQLIPVAGSVIGANGDRFVSRLSLTNTGGSTQAVQLIFTPSNADGRVQFVTATVHVAAGETLVFDDVVATLFRSAGTGNIEIGGHVTVTSEIVATTNTGVSAQRVPPARASSAIGPGGLLTIAPLEWSALRRSNVGFAETGGAAGVLRLTFVSGGVAILERDLFIAPFSHVQVPANVCASCEFTAEVRVISGGATVIGYGSVVENATGQAVFVPGVPSVQPSGVHGMGGKEAAATVQPQ